jgi:hypothetical protein
MFAISVCVLASKYPRCPQIVPDAKHSKPSELHLRMIAALKAHPEGLTELELAKELGEEQSQFGRRRRYLTKGLIQNVTLNLKKNISSIRS